MDNTSGKMRTLNEITKQMIGRPMNKEELALLENLRKKLKQGEITREQAHEVWNKKVLK